MQVEKNVNNTLLYESIVITIGKNKTIMPSSDIFFFSWSQISASNIEELSQILFFFINY